MKNKSQIFFLCLCLCSAFSFQNAEIGPDNLILKELYAQIRLEVSRAENTLAVAQRLKETAYKAGTLDQDEIEKLAVNLHGLDCWTLVESSLAVAQIPAGKEADLMPQFQKNLQNLRYRNGKIDGYGSRIHYFSEWLLQASEMGVLDDLTEQIGGVPYTKKVAFMSNHPNLYPKMKDEATISAIKKAEKRIQNHKFFYIPKAKLKRLQNGIKDGDIIAITSSKSDLDVSHEGFACWEKGDLYLIHASKDVGRVVQSTKPLVEYLFENSGQTGVMVARLKD